MDLPRLYPLETPWRDCTAPEQILPAEVLLDPFGEGERAWRIASLIQITEGEYAGARFGDVATPWQEGVIRAVWGHRDQDKKRIIRRVVLKTARKSGKTLFASILAFVEVLFNSEPRGQILLLGAEQKQSDLSFNNLAAAIAADRVLAQRFVVTPGYRRIIDKVSGTRFTAMSSERAGVIGAGANVAVIDELHLIGLLGQRGTDLVHGVESGMLSRRERLVIFITTAPRREAAGIYSEVMDHARRVFEGKEDDRRTLAVMFEIPSDMDHESPANWWRSNPNIGHTIRLDDLEDQFARAKGRGPEAIAEFKSQNLNVEPEDRESGPETWIELMDWDKAEDPLITLESLIADSTAIAVGIDVGGADDLSAMAALAMSQTGLYRLWTHCWISERGFFKRIDTTPMAEARERGELTVVDNVGEDADQIVERVLRVWEEGNLLAVGCDPYSMKEPAAKIEAETGFEVLAVPQNWRMSPWLDAFERALLRKKLMHHRSGLMRWQIQNAHVAQRGEARALVKPDGAVDSGRKIDAVVASVCAWAALEDASDSVVEEDYEMFVI